MFEILDTVIATAAVILGLSLVVQSTVQIVKQALDLKSSYMRSDLLALFSNPARTSNVVSNFRSIKRLATSADGFAKRIIGEVEDKLRSFGFSDLHLLEDVNTGNMVDILGDLPVAEDANLRDKFEEAVRSAERWFDITKRAFQEHYERRMKYWSFIISAIVVMVMNADLIAIFQEFSTMKPKRDAIVAAAPDLLGTAQGFFTNPDSVVSDADRAAIIKRNAGLIDSLVAASSFSIIR